MRVCALLQTRLFKSAFKSCDGDDKIRPMVYFVPEFVNAAASKEEAIAIGQSVPLKI